MIARGIRTKRTVLFGFAVLVSVCGAAYAHKMNVFATADGRVISGYAYTAGGERVRDAAVEVSSPAGEVLATLKTDGEGRFSFTPTVRCDHIITLSTPDGHGATFTVAASELPDDLALPSGADVGAAGKGDLQPESVTSDAPLPSSLEEGTLSSEVVSLRKQIVALRQQVDRFQERRSLQDIVGGVGYILGVAGIAFYVLGCRRVANAKQSEDDA